MDACVEINAMDAATQSRVARSISEYLASMHSEPMHETAPSRRREDEWLWGWDPTPGIVSVWAEANGRATVWRRIADTGALVCEEERFRPWLLPRLPLQPWLR